MYDGTTMKTSTGSVITDGNWHYVTATRNGTTGVSKIYVDGSLKESTTASFTARLFITNSKIGNW